MAGDVRIRVWVDTPPGSRLSTEGSLTITAPGTATWEEVVDYLFSNLRAESDEDIVMAKDGSSPVEVLTQ